MTHPLLIKGYMKRLTFVLFLALMLLNLNSHAQSSRLSQLDLSNASQTYGSVMVGRMVTGEEAMVAGEKCKDVVGVYPKSIIRINLKGFGYNLTGKIGVSDTKIDYNATDITSNPQPDGTRVFYHTINGAKYFAGVEDTDGVARKGCFPCRG